MGARVGGGAGIRLRPRLWKKARQVGNPREWEESCRGLQPKGWRIRGELAARRDGKEGRPEAWGVSRPRPRVGGKLEPTG